MVDPFSQTFTIDSEHALSPVIGDEQEFAPSEASEPEAKVQEEACSCDGEGACLISWKPRKASVA